MRNQLVADEKDLIFQPNLSELHPLLLFHPIYLSMDISIGNLSY